MARSTAGESVTVRIVRILDAFDAAHPTLTVSEVARRSGLPVTTAHRLAVELVTHGLLERAAGHQFRVGLRLWELGSRSSRALGLREAALPFMEDLQLVVRQHTQLGVLQGSEVLFLEQLSALGAVLNPTRIAARLAAHACSSGLVLLANAPSEVREAVLRDPPKRYTARTVTDLRQLRRLLAEVRKQDHAVAAGMMNPAATGVAVPVRDDAGCVVAALSVVIPLGRGSARAQVPALMATARGISRAMGTRPSARKDDLDRRSHQFLCHSAERPLSVNPARRHAHTHTEATPECAHSLNDQPDSPHSPIAPTTLRPTAEEYSWLL
jgi:DNA-binding IclR family transcriptional regulator